MSPPGRKESIEQREKKMWQMSLVWSYLEESTPQLPVRSAGQVYDYVMKNCYKPSEMGQEISYLLFVNRGGIIYGQLELSKGGTDACVLDMKIVLKAAIDSMANSVVLVHNHPTGNSMPSQADIKNTNAMRRALAAISVPLLDHVIIGNKEYYSFTEEQKSYENN